MSEKAGPGEPIVIKKYANRRLYNTAMSNYVTLENLCEMVQNDKMFVVRDARTGDDITRSVLTQIIVQQENKGQNLLPIKFLRQLIGYYGHNLESVVPNYLEASLETFSNNQEELSRQLSKAMGGVIPAQSLEEMGRQNIAIFEKAMSMFNPFSGNAPAPENDPVESPTEQIDEPPANAGAADNSDVADLKAELDQMRRRLDELATK